MIYLLFYLFISTLNNPAGQSELPTDFRSTEFLIQDSLILYNVITPNGDGDNDLLMFDDIETFTERSLLVTDQWGQKVYESNSYNNDWDGTKNGKPLPAGMYKYYLRLDGKIFSSNLSIIYN